MRSVRLSLLGLGLAFGSTHLDANIAWTGSGAPSNEWNIPGNWNPNGVPGEFPFDSPTNIAILTNNPTNIIVPPAATFLSFGGIQVNTPGFQVTNQTPNFFNLVGTGITGPAQLTINNTGTGGFDFGGDSTAGNAIINNTATGGGSGLFFVENSQAANAIINNNGDMFLGTRISPFNVGTLNGSGTVSPDNGPALINIGGGTFGGTMNDGIGVGEVLSINKVSNDTLVVLVGSAWNNIGDNAVLDGYFEMNGNNPGGGDWRVAFGGTLGGIGSVAGNVVVAGTIAPGNNDNLFGNFTMGGGYTALDTATTAFNVSGTQSSTMTVGGNTTLAGNVLIRPFSSRFNGNTAFRLINTAGATTGSFASVSGLTPRIGIRNLAALLSGAQFASFEVPFGVILDTYFGGGSGNEQSLAGALDVGSINANISVDFNNVISTFNVLPLNQFRNALRAVGSTAFTTTSITNLQNLNLISNTVHNAGVFGRDIPGCVKCPPRPCPPCPPQPCPPKPCVQTCDASVAGFAFAKRPKMQNLLFAESRRAHDSSLSKTVLALQDTYGSSSRELARNVAAHHPGKGQVWFQGFGGKTNVDHTVKDPGFDAKTTGAMMGFDYGLDETSRIGVGGGYSKTRTTIDSQLGKVDAKGPIVSVWASKSFDNFELDSGGTVQFLDYDMKRNISFSGINRTATSSYNGYAAVKHLGAAYNADVSGYHLKPFIAFDGFYNSEDKTIEKGANSLNLVLKRRSSAVLQSTLGASVDRHFCLDCGVLRPELQLAYRNRAHLFDKGVSAFFAGQPNTRFISRRTTEMRHRVGVGAELGYVSHEGGSLKIGYRGDYGKDENAHMGFISAGKSW